MNIKRSKHCGNSSKNDFMEQFTIELLSDCNNPDHLDEDYVFISHSPFELTTVDSIEIEVAISHGKYGSCLGVLNDSIPFICHIELSKVSKLIVKSVLLFVGQSKI